MDKSWMNKPRHHEEYLHRVENFLNFAFSNSSTSSGLILCPCKNCRIRVLRERHVIRQHLIFDGFVKGYTHWIAHGEISSNDPISNVPVHGFLHHSMGRDDMQGLINDVLVDQQEVSDSAGVIRFERDAQIASGVAEKFFKLIDDSQKCLYEGCNNFSKLSFIIRMLHAKCTSRQTNKNFNTWLHLLREAFPDAMADLPKSYYECEKLMKILGLGYEKIDACRNDCMLYWGINKEKILCDTCHKLRWEESKQDPTGEKRKIPHKVLWYFPIKPRLQRLFMSSKTASYMRWHAEDRINDGYMRHPADSPAWQTFDNKYPEFANEPRNVRLGLASDGMNPFGNMNVSHSTWPVVLVPYNLPPWMCMKQPYTFLSLIIPGPTAPGNDIDVYLQPLIADLKELWEVGINTYDASKNQNFQMRASLLWTISDFPGYANLSGWSTKGKLACPVCHKFTRSRWLKHGHKQCYMRHRRFLPPEHEYRRNARAFDGTVEPETRPPRLSGDMVMQELGDLTFKFGKEVKDNPKLPYGWKKRSIFFELPYWKDNLVRHNLDVMHIEKNVAESICATLLNMADKTKDNLSSRHDLELMGIRTELHPIRKENGRFYLPPSPVTMNSEEKSRFCDVLKNVKFPDGYASNFSRRVHTKPPKLKNLKSHDYHIILQQLLPVALRKSMPKTVRLPLIKLSRYFRELCSKVVSPQDTTRMENDIAIILCQLERVFPPSFFDVMVHLTVHLATELKLAGPVYYRWMYPIERYLGTLKSYVGNKARPEGSIANAYLADECLTFCSLYLADYVETKFNKTARNEGDTASDEFVLDVFKVDGNALGNGTAEHFSREALSKAHQYILFNCTMIQPYIE